MRLLRRHIVRELQGLAVLWAGSLPANACLCMAPICGPLNRRKAHTCVGFPSPAAFLPLTG